MKKFLLVCSVFFLLFWQISSRIPRPVLEVAYGISLTFIKEYGVEYLVIPPPTAEELLNAYAGLFSFPSLSSQFCIGNSSSSLVITEMRGFVTARSLPDISRAARHILKDYVNVVHLDG
jgi:hypothetical protein